MRIRLPKISWNSIRLKLVAGLFLVTVPLLALFFYNNHYSINVVHNQVAISNKNMISLYMGQIDTRLEAAEKNLLGLITTNYDIQSMDEPYDDDEYQLSKYRLLTTISKNILFYESIDAFFIYNYERKDLLDISQSYVDYTERVALESDLVKYLDQLAISSVPGSNHWYVKEIGNTHYVLRTIRSGNLYLGAWVKAQTLLGPMNLIDFGANGTALLLTSEGVPMVNTNLTEDKGVNLSGGFQKYYLTGSDNNLMVVGEASKTGDFSLAAAIPNQEILQNLPRITQLIGWLSFAAIGLVPLSLIFLHRILLLPLKRLITVMNKINKGFVNVRIDNFNTSDEFILVNQTFNKMMSQIEELKINVYEEKLSKQKAELQHLQLQINPHFFMNSLNMLFNLAEVKNYELIQEMTLCLVRYFRFMFRSNLSFVTLEEELQHVKNYIRIQELRFPGHLTCHFNCPDYLKAIQIPPLLIQTFLENSIKHGITLEEPLHLFVSLDLKEADLRPYIEIMIRDTGKGFSEQVLNEIKLGNRIIDDEGEHIGIWNARKRLSILYADEASVSCYNGSPNGAVVEIKLPYGEDSEGGTIHVSNYDS